MVAVMVPQFTYCSEYPLAFCTLISKRRPRFVLHLCSLQVLFFFLVFVPVFDEASAVLEGKAAFFAGQGQQLILMCVKVPMEVKHLALAEALAALLAHQAKFPLFIRRIGLFVIVHPVFRWINFNPQALNWRLLC